MAVKLVNKLKMIDDFDLCHIQDEKAHELIVRLLNLFEELSAELRETKAEIQRLLDEVNRLNRTC